jgi:Na+/melibiose symporter-like transporter
MSKTPPSRNSLSVWRLTVALIATFLVFGFVVCMALLGHNLVAATAAATATSIAAAEFARRLAYAGERERTGSSDSTESE